MRVDVPFERRAGAERDDRQPGARALIVTIAATSSVVVREADDVGRGGRVVRLAVAVMLADRAASLARRPSSSLSCTLPPQSAGQWQRAPWFVPGSDLGRGVADRSARRPAERAKPRAGTDRPADRAKVAASIVSCDILTGLALQACDGD